MIDYAKITILVGIFLIGASVGWYFPHVALVEYKASVKAAAEKQEAHVESIKKQQEITTKGIEKEYEAKLALLRNYYASGVRQPNTSKLPTISNATTSLNDFTANGLLVKCAETTQQLISLQAWLNEQMGVK